MDKAPNARIKELCEVTKGMGEKNDDVLRWFGHVERMENDKIAKWVYVGKCAGIRSVGRPRKRWIDTVKNCLKKRGLVHDKSVWRGFVRGMHGALPLG